jgi:hypothetical protein
MKSKSALSKAFESFTMKINDLIMRHRTLGEKMTLGHINQSIHMGRHLLQSVSIDDPGVASIGLCSSSCDESCGNYCDWRNGGAFSPAAQGTSMSEQIAKFAKQKATMRCLIASTARHRHIPP